MKIPHRYSNQVINLALDTIDKKKQALVFVNTKRGAERTAEDIAKTIKHQTQPALAEQIKKVLPKPTRQCLRLSQCVKNGIAFHHAGLTHKQKDLIEESFRKGDINIICATPTLAAGLDLPAFRTIIRDLKRYTHHGLNWIPVLEYLQQAGRAGRPKYDKYGESIAIATTDGEKDEIIKRYIHGEPEEIYSKLAVEPVLRTYLLSLIATNFVRDEAQILDFFKQTFWAHQYQDFEKLSQIIGSVLAQLENWGFLLKTSSNDFVSADEINSEKYQATPIGKRVAELYIDPLTANHLVTCLRRAESKIINNFSYLQMISCTLEMRPLLKTRVKDQEKMEKAIIENDPHILMAEPSYFDPEYQEFTDSIKTAMFFQSWISEKDEEELYTEYNIRPGETRTKLEIAEWLLYTTSELSRILGLKHGTDISKLRTRLKYGIKEELLPLIRFENIGRVRARLLYHQRIKDIKDIKKVDMAALTQLIGAKNAASLKEQVGIKVEKVKKTKRKGQMSLEKYGKNKR